MDGGVPTRQSARHQEALCCSREEVALVQVVGSWDGKSAIDLAP